MIIVRGSSKGGTVQIQESNADLQVLQRYLLYSNSDVAQHQQMRDPASTSSFASSYHQDTKKPDLKFPC